MLLKGNRESNRESGVLHIIDSLQMGGAERMSLNLCSALLDSGLDVHLCIARDATGPRLVPSFPERCFYLGKRSSFDFIAYFHLVRFAKKKKIRIVHAHSSSIFAGVVLKLFCSVRLIWHFHYGKLCETRAVWWQRLLGQCSDHFITVSEPLRGWVRGELGVESSRITNLPNFPDRAEFQCSVNASPDVTQIVAVGNARLEKDYETLLRAVKLVSLTYPDWTLVIVGSISNEEYAKKLKDVCIELDITSRVSFLGPLSAVLPILQQSAIGVISSQSEGLPVALLEYGIAGLPVVTTDVGECPAVVEYGGAGLIVPAGDHVKMADAMKLLISDFGLRCTLGNKLKTRVDKEYSSESASRLLMGVYGVLQG